jgi:hypothetical protein
MELIGKVLMLVGVAIGAWVAYKVLHDYLAERRKGTNNEPEAPYKIEFENPTVDVAIPDNPAHEAIKWTFANAPKPKRPYTKRSKYWTTNKPAKRMQKARKARKAKRKSK